MAKKRVVFGGYDNCQRTDTLTTRAQFLTIFIDTDSQLSSRLTCCGLDAHDENTVRPQKTTQIGPQVVSVACRERHALLREMRPRRQ